MDSMEAIRVTFFQECEEQLAELEAGLVAIEGGTAEPDTVNAVFRSVHSIKGGAGAFQLADLVSFAHGFETVLDEIRSGRLEPRADIMGTMLHAADVLSDLVREARDGTALGIGWREVLADLDAIARHGSVPAEPPPPEADEFGFAPITIRIPTGEPEPMASDPDRLMVEFRPHPTLFARAHDPIPVLRELARLGEARIACDLERLPPLDLLDPEQAYLAWRIELSGVPDTAVRDCFEFLDEDCDLVIGPRSTAGVPPEPEPELALGHLPAARTATAPEPSRPAPSKVSAPSQAAPPPPGAATCGDNAPPPTIRVDLDRLDRLIDLVGELVINQAMLGQRVIEAGVARQPAVATGLDELKLLTREIQESVMAIRAQPVRPLFQRMGRIVREVAAATGKVVRLRTEGEGTEVDKTVVERLADPLTHLIRNAIDHGIETPERRLAAGKPAEGTVRLVAAHRSGRVVIEVSDDGGGIDRSRVRQIAERKGLIPADAQLSDPEVDSLLFLPGFSTTETVSDISGRGVGMDVVKRSIQALGGRLAVASRPGQGSSFGMSLPLTLAVLDGMVVSVADQTLVVPLTAIMETLRPAPGDVRALGPAARVLAIRGGFVPVVDLGEELGFSPAGRAEGAQPVAVLVETSEGACAALLIDSIQDQRQVVIKSLEANYGTIPGIAAATILGNGRVALILDVDALVASSGAPASSSVLSTPLSCSR